MSPTLGMWVNQWPQSGSGKPSSCVLYINMFIILSGCNKVYIKKEKSRSLLNQFKTSGE